MNKNDFNPPTPTRDDSCSRKYPLLVAVIGYQILCGLYLLGALSPLVITTVVTAVYYGVISRFVFSIFFILIVLDFVIPCQNGYRPKLKFAQNFFRLFEEGGSAYFPAKSICKATNLDKDKSYILASWPHSLMGGGCHFCFTNFHKQGFHPLWSGASVIEYLPFLRRFMFSVGYCDVSKPSLHKALNYKRYGPTYPYNIVHLCVGGIGEMFYSNAQSSEVNSPEQIVITKRKGFIKLALETGADIIPQYVFGANQAYYRPFGPKSLLSKMSSRLKISLVFWYGRWWIPMGIVPFQVPIMSVVGDVFEVPKIDDPKLITRELVEEVHGQFCVELRKLFDAHKGVYVKEMGASKDWLTKELIFEDE